MQDCSKVIESDQRIIYGHINFCTDTLICLFGSPSAKLAKVASALFLVGVVFHSGTLYLGGLGMMAALKLAPVGAFSLVAAMALMIPIILKGVTEKE